MALIPDDPKQRNALLIGIVAAAGFYFFWSWWYSPRNTEVEEMAARLEQLDSENRRAQILATRSAWPSTSGTFPIWRPSFPTVRKWRPS